MVNDHPQCVDNLPDNTFQAMSCVDRYECYGIQDIQKIAGSSEPDHPLLILLAHDGDNAFGGGYSYYEQCVKQFVDQAEEEVLTQTAILYNQACG